jgi:curved DNA-binding protein CbpA
MNPYKILEVGVNDDLKTIKNQYKKLVLKYHPDKNQGKDEMFMKIVKAYEILMQGGLEYRDRKVAKDLRKERDR